MKKAYEEEYIQAIAEAIRTKNGSTIKYKTSEMAIEIEELPSGGVNEDGIIARTLESITNDTAESVGIHAFYGMPFTGAINLSKVKTLGESSFESASGSEINLPECIEIGSSTFKNATIQKYILPKLLSLPGYVFAGANGSEVHADSVESVGGYCFDGATFDKTVFPVMTAVAGSAFRNSKIGELYLPKVSKVNQYGIYQSQHQVIRFGSYVSIAKYGLSYPGASKPQILAVVFESPTICKLESGLSYGINAKLILVQRALVEEYKVATNWSTQANSIFAIEDYTVDGTVTGELDMTKVEA